MYSELGEYSKNHKLDKEIEEEYLKEIQNKNFAHIWDVTLSNYPLVCKIVNNYKKTYSSFDENDLIQEGLLGLRKAIEKYDSTQGALSTYAYWYIESYIQRYIDSNISPIHIPVDKIMLYRRIQRKLDNGYCLNKILKDEYISMELYKYVDNAMNVLSLECPVNVEDNTPTFLKDFIIKDLYNLPEKTDNMAIKSVYKSFVFSKIFERLTERELNIVLQTVVEEKTLEEVAHYYNVTRERIRQIQQKALRKLRYPLVSKDFCGCYDRVYYED